MTESFANSAAANCDAALLELLTVLEKSLLRYVSEADLWVDSSHAEATATIRRLAREQQESAAAIAELIARRHLLPELVNFPSAFAQLHYLALSYVLVRLVEDQQSVTAVASAVVAACKDAAASLVVSRVRDREHAHLNELERLRELLRKSECVSPGT